MDKEELIKKYGENMKDFWQILEAMLDDERAAGYLDGQDKGYDEGWDE